MPECMPHADQWPIAIHLFKIDRFSRLFGSVKILESMPPKPDPKAKAAPAPRGPRVPLPEAAAPAADSLANSAVLDQPRSLMPVRIFFSALSSLCCISTSTRP